MPKNKTAVIIGAGPAGLFAARALKKQGITPTLIEKEAVVGGKCHTYTDPHNPDIKTEWGAAMLAANYGVVLDAVAEKGVQLERPLVTQRQSLAIMEKMDSLSWLNKAYFAVSFVWQLASFTKSVMDYHYARDNQLALPDDFELPFTQYAKKYGLEYIDMFLKPLVTGFGYGAMDDIPAYCVMEYMGIGTVPTMALQEVLGNPPLLGVKDGTQHLMERVAEDFDVVTSADISKVDRSEGQVNITYTVNGVTSTICADQLVLATSPLQWTKFGMKLTAVEQECVEKLTYYRYPVAVCKVAGLQPEQVFIPPALEKEGFGHVALLTTRDARTVPNEGRLCTSYINLPAGENAFSLDLESDGRKIMCNEIGGLAGIDHVSIEGTKIWEDYMPTLPWDLRLKLEKEQMRRDTSTLYVGAYPVGGFEDIRCVADQATRAVDKHIAKVEPESTFSYVKNELYRAYGFFAAKVAEPVGDDLTHVAVLAA